MNSRTVLRFAALMLTGIGCHRRPAPTSAESKLPVASVSRPVQRKIVDYIDYTGRTEAVNAVDVRARVTGYLMKMPFKEGDEIQKDDLLFEIDPRPYQAQLEQALANVQLAKAQLDLATANFARAKQIARTPGAISQQDVDTYKANEEVAQAQVAAAEATLKVYQLNREFCEVASPIDGKVSRYYYTLGNLVTLDQTLLTTIVSLNPLYVYFDIDTRTVLRVRKLINEGKLPYHTSPDEIKLYMGLEGEQGFPHEGHINFINNTADPFTGTITLRGVFDNAKPKVGVRIMSPGLFVRVRLPLGNPHNALLVNERAVGTDQGLKFVYVVGPDNKVVYSRVTLGPLEEDGMRVVESGLKPDDWVVVSGLQQIRPKMEVSPEQIPMPLPTAQAAALGAQQANQPGAGGGDSSDSAAPATSNPGSSNPRSSTPGSSGPVDGTGRRPGTRPNQTPSSGSPGKSSGNGPRQ